MVVLVLGSLFGGEEAFVAAEPEVHDGRGGDEGGGVDEEGHAHPPPGHEAADDGAGDVAEQEGGGVAAGGARPGGGRGEADDERHRGHGEHRRAEPAERAEQEELPVALGEGDAEGRGGDDEEAGDVDGPLPQAVDQAPAGGCGDQPEEREGAHDDRRSGHAQAEGFGELGQHGGDDPVADGDDEGGGDEHPDVGGELRLRDGGVRAGAGHLGVGSGRRPRNGAGSSGGRLEEASFSRKAGSMSPT